MRVTGDLLRFSTEQDNGNSSCDRMDSPGSHGGKPDLAQVILRRRNAAAKSTIATLLNEHFQPTQLDNITISQRQFPPAAGGKHELQGLI